MTSQKGNPFDHSAEGASTLDQSFQGSQDSQLVRTSTGVECSKAHCLGKCLKVGCVPVSLGEFSLWRSKRVYPHLLPKEYPSGTPSFSSRRRTPTGILLLQKKKKSGR